MIKYYANILTKQEVIDYTNAIKQQYQNNLFTKNDFFNSIDFSYASEIHKFESCIKRIDKIIKTDFGDNYIYSHSFARIYLNDGVLYPHVDRDGLDITLSVNLYNDTEVNWPMYVSEIKLSPQRLDEINNEVFSRPDQFEIIKAFFNQQIPFEILYNNASKEEKKTLEIFNSHKIYSLPMNTPAGSGAALTASNHLHWRYPLKCAEKRKYIQVFYHWKKL